VPGARTHEFLRDVFAGEDLLPDAARELVAAVGGLAAVAERGLDEKLAPLVL
jgi:hypothetical protein